MSDEIERIIIRTEGEERVRQLTAAIAAEEANLRTLIATLGRNDAATRASAQAIADLNQQMRAASAGAGLAGHQMLQLGNAVDDLQYVGEQGLRPIINNVMQLSPALGVAMIAAQTLYNNWDTLMKLFGQGHVKTQADEMEELRKKTELTANEAERLARAENLTKKVGELRGARTDDQKIEEDASTKAMVEAGVANVARAIRATAPDLVDSQGAAADVKKEIEDKRRQLEDLKAGAANDTTGTVFGDIAKLEDQIHEMTTGKTSKLELARDKTAEDIAATGALPAEWAGQRARIADMARANPAAFGGGDAEKGKAFAESLDLAGSAAADKRNSAEDDRMIAQEGEARAINKSIRERAEAARKKTIADTTKEGHVIAGTKDSEEKDRLEQEKKAKEERKAATKAARESAPGIDNLIRDQLVQMGGSSQSAQALTRQLRGQFGNQAADLVNEQLGSAREKLMTDFIKGPDTDKERRNSQVIGAEGLAASIQSAVGSDDTAKKQLEQLQRQTVLLNTIAAGRPLVFRNGALGG